MENYYQILGVPPDASQEQLKERFRFLTQAYHPDKFATPTHKKHAEETFKTINDAYQILSNPRRRAEYDRRQSSSDSHYEEERRRREEAETARRHAEEARRKREEAEAAQRRAKAEQQRREQAEPQRRAEEERRPASVLLGILSVLLGTCIVFLAFGGYVQRDYTPATIVAVVGVVFISVGIRLIRKGRSRVGTN